MKLSFCITCWDGDFKFFNRLLPHLNSQTKLPDQFIISSSTLSLEQIKSIPTEIKGIPLKFINSKEPLYAGGARNQGAENCQTDFITFFDIDDIPHPKKIEITYQSLNLERTEAFVHNFNRGNKDFENCDPPYHFDFIKKTESIYLRPPNNSFSEVHHGHLTVKTDIVNSIGYNIEIRRAQDSYFCMDLMRNKFNIAYSPISLINYLPSTISRESL